MTMAALLTLAGLVAMGGGPPGADPGEVIRDRYVGPHGERDYRLFLPPRPPAEPHGAGSEPGEGGTTPLLVMLHGCTQDADDLAQGTRMDVLAGERGVAVLYPEQDPAAHPLRCWNWYEPAHQSRGGGEPALLAAMIREVASRHALDVGREEAAVVVAGISAGGAMATILGLTHPDLVRGVASHSGVAFGVAEGLPQATAALAGTLEPDEAALTATALAALGAPDGRDPGAQPGATTAHEPGIPPFPRLLVIHGGADEIVAPVNADWFRMQWTGLVEARTGSRPALRVSTPTGLEARGVHGQDLLTERVDPAARILRIRELGHAWSGGDEAGSYTDPRGPEASRWILDFFFPSRNGDGEDALP